MAAKSKAPAVPLSNGLAIPAVGQSFKTISCEAARLVFRLLLTGFNTYNMQRGNVFKQCNRVFVRKASWSMCDAAYVRCKQCTIVVLNNHTRVSPVPGLGVWRAEKGVLDSAIAAAIDAGYRHFDCAGRF
jgi:hypothetical protein